MSEPEVTDADREKARALWAELGRHEAAYASPEQLVDFMRRCPDSVALDYARRMLDQQQIAIHCWEADHLEAIAAHPAVLAAERARARAPFLALLTEYDEGRLWSSQVVDRIRRTAEGQQ